LTKSFKLKKTWAIQEESKVEEKVVTSEPVQKYSWDIIDVKTPEVKSETPVAAVPSTPEYVAPKTEEPLIIRHELNLEPKATTTIDNSSRKEVLSPEEMNRRTSERMSKIQELTTKLKKAEGIAEFENEPAFVRRNIALQQTQPSATEQVSRFGIAPDANGTAGLRNNSFLHDNVD
jgi:cell division protein FtsZ